MIDIAPATLADVVIAPREGFQRFIRREPLGVVLVLAPWNYPYLASVNAVIPAIMAGNSVILKMAQQTPLVAERYAEAFAEAGLPRGVFQYLHASHDDVARMIGDRAHRVRVVHRFGRRRPRRAAGGEQSVSSRRTSSLAARIPPTFVPDAPLEATIDNLVDGAYFNAGQSCCAVERIYVHRDIYREFVDGFVALTGQYRLGNPLRPERRWDRWFERARPPSSGIRSRKRNCRARELSSIRASFPPIWRARRIWRRRCWSMSITGCG